MPPLRISVVSFLNSIPFVYGLKNFKPSGIWQLSYDIPSLGAEKLINGKADIALIPVAVLPQLNYYRIISKYCIGAVGPVRSVCLYSNVSIPKISTILLDHQSRTSVLLIKILCKHFWKINPEFVDTKKDFIDRIKNTTAGLVIGDRTFSLHAEFPFQYDLSEEWQNFTGLPFVFACWVITKKLDKNILIDFETAIEYGIKNLRNAISEYRGEILDKKNLSSYLLKSISYNFDDEKKKAMKLYFKLAKSV